jgi:energy-coupling factor transport system permease protein
MYMLKDFTFGQFFPGKSFVHNADPRVKILAEVAFAVLLFLSRNYYGLLVGTFAALFCYVISGLKLTLIYKCLKPVFPIIVFSGLLNLFLIKGETLLWHWWVFSIYTESLNTAGFMVLRIVALIVAMSLLTYTTSPIAITDALENMFAPLKKIHLPVHEFAMMMTIAMRFIPTLTEETDKIMSAQKARGANLDTGGLFKRVKALIPILIPLFISAFRRAYELALAMECRCYRGGAGRTKLKKLSFSWRDPIIAVFFVGLFLSVIWFNAHFPDTNTFGNTVQ